MYKALNYWVYGGFDGKKTPYEFIDFAAEHGLDGIELTMDDALPIDVSKEECEKIAAYAASKNIRIRTLAGGFFWGTQLGADDADERARAVEYGRKYLQVAAWIGAEAVLVIPGASRVPWMDRPAQNYGDVWKHSQESVRQLIPVAAELKVKIGLENVWGRFLFSPMEWKLYLEQLDSPWVGIYFDIANCCLYCCPQDYVRVLGADKIAAIHIKNFAESDCGGGLAGFGDDLFNGIVDFKELAAALKEVGYQGPTTVEMIPFSRGENMVLPDEELAVKMTRQLKELEEKYFG